MKENKPFKVVIRNTQKLQKRTIQLELNILDYGVIQITNMVNKIPISLFFWRLGASRYISVDFPIAFYFAYKNQSQRIIKNKNDKSMSKLPGV